MDDYCTRVEPASFFSEIRLVKDEGTIYLAYVIFVSARSQRPTCSRIQCWRYSLPSSFSHGLACQGRRTPLDKSYSRKQSMKENAKSASFHSKHRCRYHDSLAKQMANGVCPLCMPRTTAGSLQLTLPM